MKIKDVMTGEPRTCSPETNLAEAAALMLDGDCGILPVIAEGKLVGVASGGTKLFPMRADRAIVYTIPINDVNAELANGTVFRISVEPIP